MNRLGVIHYLDQVTGLPACRKDAERALWNWSLEPAAVTCRSCRAGLAFECEGRGRSSRGHEHHRSITRSP